MRVRVVGSDFPNTVVHGTTRKSAKAFMEGRSLPVSERQRTYSEWGSDVIYVSEKTAPHQALMFGEHGGTGFGGRVVLEFMLMPTAIIMDAADEIVRRPPLGRELEAALKFCQRPSWTDDMGAWLYAVRQQRKAREIAPEIVASWVDPTSDNFSGSEYMPMLAGYARDKGFGAIRLTDETVIVNPGLIVGARIMSKAEVQVLKGIPRKHAPYKYASLFTEDCERF